MLQKQFLIAGSVLGALALGNQVVHADTVNQTTSTSMVQAPQVPGTSFVTSTTSSSGDFSENDDSKLPDGNKGSGSSSSSGNEGSGSSNNDSGTNTPKPTPDDDHANGSTLPNGNGSSSSDNDSSNSSSGNGGSNSSSNQGSSSPDNGGASSPSDQAGSSTNQGGTDNSNVGGTNAPSDHQTVPLTPSTPDKNAQGEINQVKPIDVTPDSTGNVVSVPTQVASVPSVARAVEAYNQALTANHKDANNDKVVAAKQQLDEAVAKALPETHATQAKSSIGILSAIVGILAMAGAFLFKHFKK